MELHGIGQKIHDFFVSPTSVDKIGGEVGEPEVGKLVDRMQISSGQGVETQGHITNKVRHALQSTENAIGDAGNQILTGIGKGAYAVEVGIVLFQKLIGEKKVEKRTQEDAAGKTIELEGYFGFAGDLIEGTKKLPDGAIWKGKFELDGSFVGTITKDGVTQEGSFNRWGELQEGGTKTDTYGREYEKTDEGYEFRRYKPTDDHKVG